MHQIRMNIALFGVVALVLALCGSGIALKCFQCTTLMDKPCTTNVSCPQTDDACLVVTAGAQKLYDCLPYNSCNIEVITKKFTVNNFSFHCCQKDLCNSSVMTTVNKTIFSLVTIVALIWICL